MSVNFSDAFFDNYCVGDSYETDDYNDQYENQDDDIYAPLENNYKSKQDHDINSGYYKFIDAVIYRLKTNYFKDNGIDRINFKDYPGISYEGILNNFSRVLEIKPVKNNPYFEWWCENQQYYHLSYRITEDWIKGEGIDFLENFIIENIVPYAKKYYPNIPEKKITRQQVEKEIENAKTKNPGGRPVGSKNKKNENKLFLPIHKIPTKNNKIVLEALIFALADIVWRYDGIIYSKAISQLDLTDSQKKYVAALILKNSNSIQNKYFEVRKVNEFYLLFKKIEIRQGYYVSNGILMSSSKISEKTGIKKTTLINRLKKMSVYDATKDWQYNKNML